MFLLALGLRRVGGRRFSIDAEDVTWSPDGRYLAHHGFENGITVVEASGRRDYEFELGQYSSGARLGTRTWASTAITFFRG